jgi:Arc/MetJ family transcription regulator
MTIEIDRALLRQAMKAEGTKTIRETVERALELLIGLKRQEGIRRFRGKVQWEGSLGEMRGG